MTLGATAHWQSTTVDLSTYRGQIIDLRFVWLSRLAQPTDPGVDFWMLNEIRIENIPTGMPPTPMSMPA
ncbi:MAG TPA: hypothetical protein VJZ27_18120 [Aggregatilineales bacterium]|nr:hypothetical protein [Aggregatilineales bacterium]